MSTERLQDGVLKYPVIHPPPRLESLSIDNDLGDYFMFDFKLLDDWLHPTQLADSLQYFHGGGMMDWPSIGPFLTGLGTSPVVKTVRMFIESSAKKCGCPLT